MTGAGQAGREGKRSKDPSVLRCTGHCVHQSPLSSLNERRGICPFEKPSPAHLPSTISPCQGCPHRALLVAFPAPVMRVPGVPPQGAGSCALCQSVPGTWGMRHTPCCSGFFTFISTQRDTRLPSASCGTAAGPSGFEPSSLCQPPGCELPGRGRWRGFGEGPSLFWGCPPPQGAARSMDVALQGETGQVGAACPQREVVAWRRGLGVAPGCRCCSGRWLKPLRPALRNTNVRQIQLPIPEGGVSFHLDRYPRLPASAGALSWQPNPSQEETPAKALLPAPAPARPPVRLSACPPALACRQSQHRPQRCGCAAGPLHA